MNKAWEWYPANVSRVHYAAEQMDGGVGGSVACGIRVHGRNLRERRFAKQN
jgi:hypothetical protein